MSFTLTEFKPSLIDYLLCDLLKLTDQRFSSSFQYLEDGYVVLDGLLTPQECDELRQKMTEIVDHMEVPEHCRITFSTYHDEQLEEQVI